MKLVIVESPTKAKTISKFLGPEYKVQASMGHVRDLPVSKMGVDVANDFEPSYVTPTKAKKTLTNLKKLAADADTILLATDEDREGEAIAWHLCQALGINAKQTPNPKSQFPNKSQTTNSKTKKTIPYTLAPTPLNRIVFHEITKDAILHALENPRELDMNMVNAQQARRVLDRLVGYELSPFLWKKVMKGLSAGRVQSVSVRLIVEREREITAFKPQEYWSIEAEFMPCHPEHSEGSLANAREPASAGDSSSRQGGTQNDNVFSAKLHSIDSKPLDKFTFTSKEQVDPIVASLKSCSFQISEIIFKEVHRNPLPPFITSTLQQEANHRLGFSAKQTMMLAQRLYEEGNITYMRTDSVNLADKFLSEAAALIKKDYGATYAPDTPRKFANKNKTAQEAHEAIRPTEVSRTPEAMKAILEEDQYELYALIWQRALACQMMPAKIRQVTIDIENVDGHPEATGRRIPSPQERDPSTTLRSAQDDAVQTHRVTFRATGSTLAFDGFLRVYRTDMKETILPPLSKKEVLDLKDLKGEQHFTEPPARYSDATLVQALEEHSIGRPSTYAPTIATVVDRGYVERMDKRRLKPTEIAYIVNDLLVAHFPHIVDLSFTAEMENSLDDIAEGKKAWVPVLQEFYTPFKANLVAKEKEIQKKDVLPEETTTEICDLCGAPMKVRRGRFGKFLGCSTFPKCKGLKKLASEQKSTGMACPKCGSPSPPPPAFAKASAGTSAGPLPSRERQTINSSSPLGGEEKGEGLPYQGGTIIEKRTKKGRTFWGCNKWPSCDFASWKNPALPQKEETCYPPSESLGADGGIYPAPSLSGRCWI